MKGKVTAYEYTRSALVYKLKSVHIKMKIKNKSKSAFTRANSKNLNKQRIQLTLT